MWPRSENKIIQRIGLARLKHTIDNGVKWSLVGDLDKDVGVSSVLDGHDADSVHAAGSGTCLEKERLESSRWIGVSKRDAMF